MATKTETIAIKVTPEEKETIKNEAAAADMTVSKFLHRLVFTLLEEVKNDRKSRSN